MTQKPTPTTTTDSSQNALPTPTPTPGPTGGLTVAITQPTSGATLSGTSWAVVWVAGSNSSNTITVRWVEGRAGNEQTGHNGAASPRKETTEPADGSQPLTV